MKKLESTLTNMVLVLTGVAVIMGGILAFVNHLTEGPIADQKAKALADTVTRVQKPSGRIPTFWEGVNTGDSGMSAARYDWLNCMAAAANALCAIDGL